MTIGAEGYCICFSRKVFPPTPAVISRNQHPKSLRPFFRNDCKWQMAGGPLYSQVQQTSLPFRGRHHRLLTLAVH